MKKSIILSLMLLLLRLSLGIFFLWTSIQKFSDLPTTALFITRSLILPESFSYPLACIGVAMEFIVALGLITRCYYGGISLWASLMSGTFLLLFTQAWLRGLDLSCNCTGNEEPILNYPLDVGLRLLLFGSCLLLVWDAKRLSEQKKPRKNLDFSDA